jgi:hypothetical protein
MAAAERFWRILVLIVLLWVGGRAVLCAQNPAETGGITGRLTDLHSHPLAGATLILQNQKTGVEQKTTTEKNGAYLFLGLEPGEYRLLADSDRLGQGELDDILVAAGHTAKVQAAIDLQPPLAGPTQTAATPQLASTPALATAPATITPAEPQNATVLEPLAKPPAETVAARIPEPEILPPPEPAPVVAAVAPQPRTQPIDPPVASPSAPTAIMPLPALPLPDRAAALVPNRPVQPLMVPAAAPTPVAILDGVRAKAQPTEQHQSLPALTAEQLQSLPAQGRRWQDFVLDSSSPASTDATHSSTAQRSAATPQPELTVDGSPSGTAFGQTGGRARDDAHGVAGDPAAIGQVWSGGHRFALAEAAVSEVRSVSAARSAESSQPQGPFDVETRRGSNDWHGQGFIFGRQNAWGARNPFSVWTKETTAATSLTTPVFTTAPYTPDQSEISWGLGLGRHIRHDRLFWFAALDHMNRDDPGMATVKHPSVFFAQPTNDEAHVLASRLGLSGTAPIVEGIAAYGGMLETLAGLLGPAPRSASQWSGFGRVDWEPAERYKLTFESSASHWIAPGGGLTRASEPYGSHSFGSSSANQYWALSRWEAFLTPNLLAVSQGSAERSVHWARPDAPSTWEKTLLSSNNWGQLPQIAIDPSYGFTVGNPARFGPGAYPDEHRYSAQERLDWAHGSLMVRAGLEFDHVADSIGLLRNQTGTYHYSRVENFISDALSFASFGISGQLNELNQHNCDPQEKAWRDSAGTLRGLGYLPCYSYYTQTMGPSQWHLSQNQWAGYATAEWQPARWAVASAGLRWEFAQMPPPISALANSDLSQAGKMPSQDSHWEPRLSLAIGNGEGHWPVLRLGAGEYIAPIHNLTLLRPLTQTGSSKGDLHFFMRPMDNLQQGGAPPFPYVLTGEPTSMVKPDVVEFASGFRLGEIHQAEVGIEEKLPWHLQLNAAATVSLGRRLPISIDTNFDSTVNPGTITYEVVDSTGTGPIQSTQLTVPFYAKWPSGSSSTGYAGRQNTDYQQIVQIFSRANSTYEAAMVHLSRYSSRGLGFRLHYTYSHAMDWNPNESTLVDGSDILDPGDFKQEYAAGDMDIRHTASADLIWSTPWKLRGLAAALGNGWRISAVGQYRSGLPYSMRTSGSLPHFYQSGEYVVALGPGMNGSGGDNRVYGVGRNTYRYPQTWKADLRLARRFHLGQMRELELLAESFNLLNHRNVTQLETIGYTISSGSDLNSNPKITFLDGSKDNTTAFGQPLNVNSTNYFRERQIQFGLRLRF